MYPKDDSVLKRDWFSLTIHIHFNFFNCLYLIRNYGVDPELRIPVGVGRPAGGHEGGVGGLPLLVMVDNEPVVVGVAVELGCDGPLVPVDDLAVLPGPARQTSF